MRLIDADDFIARLNHVPMVQEAIKKAVDHMPTIESEQRWTPTSECLPKVREWVLCQCRVGIMDVLRLTGDGDWNKSYPNAEYMSGFVIAWMPLPAAYREENPTPTTFEAAVAHLTEETADVLLYLQEIRERHGITLAEINNIMTLKRQRWAARLEGKA